jgi:hypothetical protein
VIDLVAHGHFTLPRFPIPVIPAKAGIKGELATIFSACREVRQVSIPQDRSEFRPSPE